MRPADYLNDQVLLSVDFFLLFFFYDTGIFQVTMCDNSDNYLDLWVILTRNKIMLKSGNGNLPWITYYEVKLIDEMMTVNFWMPWWIYRLNMSKNTNVSKETVHHIFKMNGVLFIIKQSKSLSLACSLARTCVQGLTWHVLMLNQVHTLLCFEMINS